MWSKNASRFASWRCPFRFKERFLEESLPLMPSHDVFIVGLPLDLQIRVESCIDRQETKERAKKAEREAQRLCGQDQSERASPRTMNEACFVFEVAPAGTVLKGFLHHLLYYFRVNRQFCNAQLLFKYPPLCGKTHPLVDYRLEPGR